MGNKRKGRSWVAATVLLLTAAAMLTSCATSANPAETTFEEDVKQGVTYRIRGEGPDGAFFGWRDVDSKYIALTEIRRGEWTLYAEKLDADGNTIATGSVNTFVSEEKPVADIAFTSDGVGDVNCDLSWNLTQCRNPNVKVFLQDNTGNWFPRPEAEVTIGEDRCSGVWNANGVDAGSYTARFVLYDGETEIAGAASALRVVDGYVSLGDVEFAVGYCEVPFGVRVGEEPVFAPSGTIAVENGCAIYRNPDGSVQEVEWYINGDSVSTGFALSLDTTLNKDVYRLDAVAEGDNVKSSASATVIVHTDGVFEVRNVEDSSIGFRNQTASK